MGKLETRAEGYQDSGMSFRSNLGFWLKDEDSMNRFVDNFKFTVEYFSNGQIKRIGEKKDERNRQVRV